jgi:hypothetical protein
VNHVQHAHRHDARQEPDAVSSARRDLWPRTTTKREAPTATKVYGVICHSTVAKYGAILPAGPGSATRRLLNPPNGGLS